jgi:peptidoglycan-associated lipoprotein
MMLSLLSAVLVLTGCPPKNKMKIDEKATAEEPVVNENADANAVNPGDIQINQDWTEIPALSMIHFDLNSASLDAASRGLLKTNVEILKKLPKTVTIRVEGHCDDRGTIEYNFALGQSRARAVQSYYITAGLGKDRVDTISFGEERPTCTEATDACWAQNRRGVTKVKNKEKITIKSGEL